MGKKRCSHWFFAIFAMFVFTTNVFAAGYTCPTYKVYTGCAEDYYLSDCGTTYDGRTITSPSVQNSCNTCPTGYTCAGGAVCPKPTTVTITYNLNGGTGTAPSATQCTINQSCSLNNSTTIYRAGYARTGWSKSSGTGQTDNSDKFTFTTNSTVYVAWKACTTNTFKTAASTSWNCSSCPVGSGSDTAAASCTCFDGWHVDGESDTTTTTIGKDCLFKLPIDQNGGTGGISSIDITECTDPIAVTAGFKAPIKAGYTFVKYLSSGGGSIGDLSLVPTNDGSGALRLDIGSNTATYFCLEEFYNVNTYDWKEYFTQYPFQAVWTANTYTVKYNANGGTGIMADVSHTYDVAKNLTANTFTNGTKKFLGWSTSNAATTATYTNGQSVSNLTTTNGGTVTLYAVWGDCTPCAAGTGATCSLSATNGVCTYTTACSTGYSNIVNSGKYNPSCTANTYAVTYSCGDGTGTAPAGMTATYNSNFTPAANLCTRTGYTFAGWTVSGTSDVKPAGTAFKWTYTTAKTMTAKWTPNVVASAGTKTLTYNGTTTTNGTAQSCANVTVTTPSSGYTIKYRTSSSAEYSATAPTLTSAGSITVYYQVSATGYETKTGSYTCKMNTKDMVVSAPSKTLTYNGSEQPCDNVTVTTPTSGATVKYKSSSSGTSGGTQISDTYTTTAPKLTNVGTMTVNYQVSGANFTTKTGSYMCTMKTAACTLNLSATSGSTVYPTAKTFTISGAKGTPTVSSSNTNVATAAISGTTVTMTPKAAGTTTITVTDPGNANYAGCSKTYQLTVSTGGIVATVSDKTKVYDGTALSCAGVSNVAPSNASVTYSTSSTGTYSATAPTQTNAGEQTVYYKITLANYDTKSGSFKCSVTQADNPMSLSSSSGSMAYSSTGVVSILNAKGTLSVASDNTNVATAVINLKAKSVTITSKAVYGTATITVTDTGETNYKSVSRTYVLTVNKGTITLNNQGAAAAGTATIYQTYDTNVYLDSARANAMTTSANAITRPTKDGYTFAGYYDSTSHTTQYINANGYITSTGLTAGKALKANSTWYAKWTANTYTVQYNANGGTGEMADASHTYDVSKTLTANAFTNGTKKFLGWATTAGGTKEYDNNASVKNLTTTNGGTVTLYAVWGDCAACSGTGVTCTLTAPNGVCTYTTACKTGYNTLTGNGTATASCTPDIYTITLNHNGGTSSTNTIYLKYNTGWYSNSAATNKITSVSVPTGPAGQHFGGYQSTTNKIVVGVGGLLTTEYTMFTSNATITAIWSTNDSVTCPAGQYYGGTGTTCTTCPAGSYCPGVTAIQDIGTVSGLNTCPAKSHSGTGASACTCDTGYSVDGTKAGGTSTTANECRAISYSVQYSCNDGNGTIPFATVAEYDASFTVAGFICDESICDRTTGYTFTGWMPVKNAPGSTKAPNESFIWKWTQDEIMSAQWKPNEYSAIYKCENGATSTEPAEYGFEFELESTSTCAIPAGKSFWGWISSEVGCEDAGNTFQWNFATDIEFSPVYKQTATQCKSGQYLGYGECDQDYCVSCPADVNGGTVSSPNGNGEIGACYAQYVNEAISHGTQTRVCKYDAAAKTYSRDCTVTITRCDGGYYASGNACIPVGRGYFSANGATSRTQCPDGGTTDGDTSTVNTQCYQVCAKTIANGTATPVSAHVNYTGTAYPQCMYTTACDDGYEPETTHPTANPQCLGVCPAGYYCPIRGGEPIICPTTHPNSPAGASSSTQCWGECAEYALKNGTAIPIKDVVYSPEQCTFRGVADNGLPCEIRGDTCVITSCPGYMELINGECRPCDREHAISYKETGNCMVETCELGYHPDGKQCTADIKSCTVENADDAYQYWDAKKGAFGECVIRECGDGFHIASNTCVPDEQPCTIAHGLGTHTWNHATGTWNKCIATSCEPGYSNDPSETNEGWEQCGRCNNMFTAPGGEVVVSSYASGCEIATCMYQGEIYNLEGNECVPICNERSDYTGTVRRVGNKCVRTCAPGYINW